MKKMTAMLLCLLIVFSFAGCSGEKDPGLSDKYDAKIVEQETTAVIHAFDDGDFEGVFNKMDTTMQEAIIDAASLEAIWDSVADEIGSFEKIEDIVIGEADGYAVSQSLVKFSDKSVIVKLSFNEDMQISGLFFQ